MRTSIRSLLGIVAMVVWTGGITAPAIAQVAVVPVEPEPAVKPFQLRFGYGYQANTDLKKSGGDFHHNDWMGSLNAQVSFSDDF